MRAYLSLAAANSPCRCRKRRDRWWIGSNRLGTRNRRSASETLRGIHAHGFWRAFATGRGNRRPNAECVPGRGSPLAGSARWGWTASPSSETYHERISSLSASLIVPLLYARTSCCAGMLYSWKDVFSRLGCSRSSRPPFTMPRPAHRQAASSAPVCLRQPARRDEQRGNQRAKAEKPVVAQKRRADDAEQKEEKRCFSLLYRKLRWVGRVYRRSLSFYRL